MSDTIDRGETKELLAQERWDESDRSVINSQTVFSTPYDLAHSLLFNPGRFSSPLSFLEKVKLRLFVWSAWIDFFNFFELFFHAWNISDTRVPYSWQILLRYLHREGVIQDPYVGVGKLRHDAIKTPIISLYASGTHNKLGGFSNVLDPEVAISKAIGELLERRFLFSEYRGVPGSQRFCCYELEKRECLFVRPARLCQFSDAQKVNLPELQFNEETIFSWVLGKNILTNQKVLLPEQLVFLSNGIKERLQNQGVEPIIRDANTNGSAGHFSFEEAVLAGIYECVERDGFLLYWLNGIAPSTVDVSGVENEELRDLLQKASRYHFEVRFLNTTTDMGIPSCVCVLIDRSKQGPRITFGGGCGWNTERMLLSSLYEALSVENWSAFFSIPDALNKDYAPFSDASFGRQKRISIWRNADMFPKIESFIAGPMQDFKTAFPRRSFRSVRDEYSQILDIFRAKGEGYEVYVYERQHRVLDTIGYHVVKVIIPELLHLHLRETLAPLGARRLQTALQNMGYTSSSEGLNPWPHPFP